MNTFSDDRPITMRDLKQILTTVTTQDWYIKANDYRRILGYSPTQFSKLKKLGRFDKGTHPATLGRKFILIHRFFNPFSQQIEWQGNPSEPIKPKKRGKHVQKDKKGAKESSAGNSKLHKAECSPSQRAGNATGQYMSGSEERPQTGDNSGK